MCDYINKTKYMQPLWIMVHVIFNVHICFHTLEGFSYYVVFSNMCLNRHLQS